MDQPSCSTSSDETKLDIVKAEDVYFETSMEIVKDDKLPVARLLVKGMEVNEKELVVMTIEEAQNYILTRVGEYLKDPNINPLLKLKNEALNLEGEAKARHNDVLKMNKMFESLYKDQLKFLRHIGVLPKPEMKTVGVGVDLPWLQDSISSLLREDLAKPKSENLFMHPGSSGSTTSSPAATAIPIKKELLPPKPKGGSIECIDLTDDDAVTRTPSSAATTSATTSATATTSVTTSTPASRPASAAGLKSYIVSRQSTSSVATSSGFVAPLSHPAPLPSATTHQANDPEIPPKPLLHLSLDDNGLVLQWDLPPPFSKLCKIIGFEIFGYQEKSNVPISSALWKKIGCVNPMPLPMSCTLTQFVAGNKYHFAIRAIGSNSRFGQFSTPTSIYFPKSKN